MGNLKHASVNSCINNDAEWEATDLHIFTSQAVGDVPYASSTTQLSSLSIGATNKILTVIGGVPTWQSTLAGLTFTTPVIASIYQDAGLTKLMTVPDTASDTLAAIAATQTLTNKTLTSPTINGTIATTGLTLPAHTSGNLSLGGAYISNVSALYMGSTTAAGTFRGNRTFANQGIALQIATYNASDVLTYRLYLTGGYDTAVATWSAITHTGLVLSGALTLNGQVFDAGSGSARINSTGSFGGLNIYTTNNGNLGPSLKLYHISTSPADGDVVLEIEAHGKDVNDGNGSDTFTDEEWGRLRISTVDVTTGGSEESKFQLYLKVSGAINEAMTLSGAGVLAVDLAGGGAAAQVDLFDQYDDALMLRQGIQQNNRELLTGLGVLERKDTGSGYMMNIQPMTRLLAGGVYQNRAKIDDLDDRLNRLEMALPSGN